MKKFKLNLSFVIVFLLSLTISLKLVQAAPVTTDQLPGGANYLDPANYLNDYVNVDMRYPTLIKANTEYSLSMADEVYNGTTGSLTITFYDVGGSVIAGETISKTDYSGMNALTDVVPLHTYMFTTPSNAHKIEVDIDCGSGPWFDDYGLQYIMLNEDIFEGWEDYVAPTPSDTSAPAFSGTGLYLTNNSTPVSVATIKSTLSAVDNVDGNVTDQIVIANDEYTGNELILGDYDINFTVSDSVGNTAYFTMTVRVLDIEKPVFSGNNYYNKGQSETLDVATIKASLSATDNTDGNLTASIVLESDNYTTNETTVGSYVIQYSVVDASGNKQYIDVDVDVYDDIKPVITGATTLDVSMESTLLFADVTAMLSATDNEDGVITGSLVIDSENYSGHETELGSYTITYSVTDSNGNVDTHIVTVTVIDDIPPVIFADSRVITIDVGNALTHQDIVDIFIASGVLDANEDVIVTQLSNTYTGNEDSPGVYLMSFQIEYIDGTVLTKDIEINVLGFETIVDDLVVDSGFWSGEWELMKTISNDISDALGGSWLADFASYIVGFIWCLIRFLFYDMWIAIF